MFGKDKTPVETDTLEIWAAWDDNGDYETGPSQDTAIERYTSNIGDGPIRVAKLSVTVPLPTVLKAETEIAEQDAMALVFVTR